MDFIRFFKMVRGQSVEGWAEKLITSLNAFATIQYRFSLRVVTASETYSPDVKTRMILFVAIGGGASGGSVDGQGAGTAAASSAGSGAGTVIKLITEPEKNYTITIGTAGAAPAAGANDGNNGVATTITSSGGLNISAGGGLAGMSMTGTSGSGGQAGSAGGTASGGDINIPGSSSSASRVVTGLIAQVSTAGTSILGGAVNASLTDANGNTATTHGGGGSGCRTSGTTSNFAGGAGSAGVVYILEIY